MDQAWLYTLAYAQRRTGVSIHCASKVINHHHIDLTDNHENHPDFFELFHGELSSALNNLLGRERYDQPSQIFDDKPTHVMRLLDPEAQAAHLVYESVQCVAAGLVTHPEHMPGFVFDFGMWKGAPIRVRRPDFYFDRKRREEYLTLTLEPPAQLYRAFGGDLDRLIHHMRRRQADAIRELNRARKWPVMGAQRVKRIHPYSEPRTRRETGGEVVPPYKQGAAGLTGRLVHIQARTEVTTFRREHREAMKALRSEQRKDRVVYPYGTYKMRRLLDVNVEAPDPSLLITGPEPTLEEVKAEFRENPRAADDERVHERVSELLSDVAGAFRAEALEVVKTDALELVSEPRRVPQELIDESSRPETLVQHRFDKRVPTEARRIVVHRDARRGRPRKGGGPKRRNVDEPLSRADADPPRGGSDPPR